MSRLGQATSGRFCTVRPQFLNSMFLMMRVKVPSDSFTWLRLGLELGSGLRVRVWVHEVNSSFLVTSWWRSTGEVRSSSSRLPIGGTVGSFLRCTQVSRSRCCA